MNYFYYIKILSKLEEGENLTELIWADHPLGVEENRNDEVICYTAYFVDGESVEKLKAEVEKLGNYKIGELGRVEQKDWIEDWMRQMKPRKVGKSIVINYDLQLRKRFRDKIVITIVPGLAFGTGFHESTVMCMKEINSMNLRGKTILDVGSGTGILSILAIKKGAKKAVALDIEEDAVRETIKNSYYNKVAKKITTIIGTVDCLIGVNFDLIFSNLFKRAIMDHMERIISMLKPGGKWILSGITLGEKMEIDERLRLFSSRRKWCKMNEWVCCTFTK